MKQCFRSLRVGHTRPWASFQWHWEAQNAKRWTGMIVGFILRITSSSFIQNVVSFDYQFFFNLLLPPIILASGYELHQV